jgi:hypothetical protein
MVRATLAATAVERTEAVEKAEIKPRKKVARFNKAATTSICYDNTAPLDCHTAI